MEILLAAGCGFFFGMIAMLFIYGALLGIANADKQVQSEMRQDVSEFEELVAKTRNEILERKE